MKIFIVSRGIPDDKYPQNGIFEYDQAKALVSEGMNVTMLVVDFRSFSFKRKFGFFNYNKNGIEVFELSLPLNIYRRLLPVLQLLLKYIYNKAVKKIGVPDVIHAHFYFIGAIASCLKKKNISWVITEHSSKLNMNLQSISHLDIKLAKIAYKNASLIIAVSKNLADYLHNNFNVNPVVIDNMIDDELFQYSEHPVKDDFTFVSVGNLVKIKAFDILVEAFCKTFDKDEKVFLNIIGDGPEKELIENIINKYNRTHQIRLLGRKTREEIVAINKESDAFVLASLSETFGLSYIEAMMSGLPVIATRCGGPENFINDNNGILIDSDDVVALSDGLRRMYNDAKLFDYQYISQYCIKRYSPHIIAKKIISAYNAIKQ